MISVEVVAIAPTVAVSGGDVTTPWWYPSQTSGGSIREDRLVLPIPPGTSWSDVKPIVLPSEGSAECKVLSAETKTEKRSPRKSSTQSSALSTQHSSSPKAKATINAGAFRFGSTEAAKPQKTLKPPKQKQPKQKNDPKLVAAARELRDRYLEQCNNSPTAAIAATAAKYDVSRAIAGDVVIEAIPATKQLAAKQLAA